MHSCGAMRRRIFSHNHVLEDVTAIRDQLAGVVEVPYLCTISGLLSYEVLELVGGE